MKNSNLEVKTKLSIGLMLYKQYGKMWDLRKQNMLGFHFKIKFFADWKQFWQWYKPEKY